MLGFVNHQTFHFCSADTFSSSCFASLWIGAKIQILQNSCMMKWFYETELLEIYLYYFPNFEMRVTKLWIRVCYPEWLIRSWWNAITLESGIDIGQGISIGPGKFVKIYKCRALNKRRAWTKCAKLCYKNPIKHENICRPWKKFQSLINVWPFIRL